MQAATTHELRECARTHTHAYNQPIVDDDDVGHNRYAFINWNREIYHLLRLLCAEQRTLFNDTENVYVLARCPRYVNVL